MFETVELDRTVTRKEFKEREPVLRERLLVAQQQIRQARTPVLVVFGGVDGGGKSETTDLLNAWMDPRWIVTRAYDDPTDEERQRPWFWRYWRDLPSAGQIGIFLSAWYSRPLLYRAYGGGLGEFDEMLDQVVEFERMLVEDGALVIKFWMHLSADVQKERLQALEGDPQQSWRIRERDWKHYRMYGEFIEAAERLIMRTSTGLSPWHLVEGADPAYRSLKVGRLLDEAIGRHLVDLEDRRRIECELAARRERDGKEKGKGRKRQERKGKKEKKGQEKKVKKEKDSAHRIASSHTVTILSRLDLGRRIDKRDYADRLPDLENLLGRLQREAHDRGLTLICVLEGMDAAGKGGAIRRMTRALNAKRYQVIPIASPTDEERAHHYLWRFWRHLPREGRVTIFDRSWYGRVLVERVEGFATEMEWRRAYNEINHFERMLVESGTVLAKFWIQISADEQLKRFKERQRTPHKRWKLTDEDWRNRARWPLYENAVHDMVERTSSQLAPWTLVEGDDKRFARLRVLETVCERLQGALERGEAPTGREEVPPA